MIELLILRHAPTPWNAERRLQGRTDIALDAAGRALAAGWRLPVAARDLDWWTSPLARARQTAEILGLAPRPDPRLAEMGWGVWEGRRLAGLRNLGELTPEMEGLGLDFRPPGGESPRDVQNRLRPWLAGLTRPTGAVAHAGVIRALYALASGWDMRARPPVRLIDGAAHSFVVRDGVPDILLLNIKLD